MLLIRLFITFFKIGLFSFGGGSAMIPLIQKEVVEINGWLTLSQMADIIVISQMTPGPIAINIATFVGYKTVGIWGSAISTLGVITPSFLIVLLIARFYDKYQQLDVVRRIFKGVRPLIVALIAVAGFFIAGTSIVDIKTLVLLAVSFVLVRIAKISVLGVIFISGLLGIILF